MELIGSSLVPVNPVPYAHLGYVSALPPGSRDLGSLGSVVGPVYSLGVLAGVAGLLLLRRSRLAGILGAALAGLCLAAGWGITNYAGTYSYDDPAWATGHLQQRVVWAAQSCPWPDRLTDAEALRGGFFQLKEAHFRDGWHRPFRLQAVASKGKVDFTVTSAGADGHFGSRDDIVRRESWPLRPAPARASSSVAKEG